MAGQSPEPLRIGVLGAAGSPRAPSSTLLTPPVTVWSRSPPATGAAPR